MNANVTTDEPWVVTATEARTQIERGATVLDTRRGWVWWWLHAINSVPVQWQMFAQSEPWLRGLLSERHQELTETLRALGVCRDRPVIVVGNPASAWGEEGRVVWTLRSLGHDRAAWVDGGWPALRDQVALRRFGGTPGRAGEFTVRPNRQWTIDHQELKAIASVPARDSKWVILDARSPREYEGATPYGERRGGRIPGALSFPIPRLRQSNGYLQAPEAVLAELSQLGVDRDTPVAVYCTGGVRSAFVVSVLVHWGFRMVKNYAGSTWEWSALPAAEYPLERSRA
ncbi:MAG: rhodanese-like domain-containing protein [Cyanobacteria bacterium P01_F01_bin.33]